MFDRPESSFFSGASIAVFAAWICAVPLLCSHAAEPQAGARQTPTAAEIRKQLTALEKQKDLGEEVKKQAADLYQKGLQQLEKLKTLEEAIASFDKDIRDATTRTARVKSQRAALSPAAAQAAVPDNLSLTQLEQQAETKDQTAKDKAAALAKLDAEPKRRAARVAEMPRLLKEAQQQVADAEAMLAAPGAQESDVLAQARQTLGAIQQRAAAATMAALEKEQAAYQATDEAIRIERDIAAYESARADAEARLWRNEVNRRRKVEAEHQAKIAVWAEARAIPAVENLAKNNSELAKQRIIIADQITKADKELESDTKTLKEIRTQFQRMREKVEAVGLSDASGQLLRQQRAKLPDVRHFRQKMSKRKSDLASLQFEIYQCDDRLSDLANLDQQVRQVLRQHAGKPAEALRAAVREVLEKEREYRQALASDYRRYQSVLIELNAVDEELVGTTEAYASYIEERVLWVRSTFPLSRRDVKPALDALRWLSGPQLWVAVLKEFFLDALRDPLILAVFVTAFGSLTFVQRRSRRRIAQLGESAVRRSFSQFVPTVGTLVGTLVISIPWPGLLWYAGWRLHRALFTPDAVRAVASGMITTAAVFFPLELIRQVCRPHGLGQAHFDWPVASLRSVRKHVHWLMVFGLPLVFVVKTMDSPIRQPWNTSLGRAAFIAFLVLIACFLQRVLRPSGSMRFFLAYRRDGWLYRLRYLWYPLTTLSPLGLAVLAGVGFYDTAAMLAVRLFETTLLMLGLVTLGAIFNRWVLVIRRRMAMEQARQRREAPAQGQAEAASAAPGLEDAEVDLAATSVQTRQLVHTALVVAGVLGAWVIWDDIVPALNIMQTVPLWPGAQAITVGSVLVAGAILSVTYVAARDFPGLLEFVVLQHLPFDTGARYAFTSICRYLLVVVGVVAAGYAVGITWNSIQWLIAALSIGLGFGLQEIFANFVSGIILLFERPIRVGDVITLGDTTGTVTRIRIRATTVTDWDLKEYVVPNKDLVTGRLLNWTLSDQVNRILIRVGVAYGTDTERATEVLRKVARDHPVVLDDPEPVVTFDGFGDSSLDMTLRCYVPSVEERLPTIHDLHTAIDAAFKQAGIEIPFPQRDVHLRTIEPPPRAKNGRIPDSGDGGGE